MLHLIIPACTRYSTTVPVGSQLLLTSQAHHLQEPLVPCTSIQRDGNQKEIHQGNGWIFPDGHDFNVDVCSVRDLVQWTMDQPVIVQSLAWWLFKPKKKTLEISHHS